MIYVIAYMLIGLVVAIWISSDAEYKNDMKELYQSFGIDKPWSIILNTVTSTVLIAILWPSIAASFIKGIIEATTENE